MDRNQLIGFALIFIILMWWSSIRIDQAPIEELTSEEYSEYVEANQDTAKISTAAETTTIPSDSMASGALQSQYASFAPSAVGTASKHILENDKLRLTFSNKGGKIISAIIKDHYKYVENEDGEEIRVPVELMENERNKFEYILNLNNRTISSEDLYFKVSKQGNKITFTALTSSGGSMQQIYEFTDKDYEIAYDVKFNGLNNELSRDPGSIRLNWINVLDELEKNVMFEERYSTVYYKPVDDGSDYCSCTGDDVDELNSEKIEWVSHTHQFFNSSIINKGEPFEGGVFSTEMSDNEGELKTVGTTLGVPYNNTGNQDLAMLMYIGPNEYENLNAYQNDLEEIIPFGRSIFGDINRHVIRPAFNFLLKFIGSKGMVIIVLIFIIKMLLYPLYYKMLHSQAKMGALKPELAGLKTKFKDDAQKVQMETMKIYREYGVSPLGGCMPMVVQIPIWYALFRFFPASITFRQEKFLWANDLSSYDAFIDLPFDIPTFGSHLSLFTILWAISTVMYSYYNMKHMDMSSNPAMKYIQYLMPLMFFVYFNNYASGLTCYMFFSNLMNILQTVITKKFVFDDDKIRAELEKKKEQPKKRSKFQQRLEEAMKQQQMQKKPKKK